MRLQGLFTGLLLILGVCLSAPRAFPQISGDIEVKILDASGSAIPNAKITIRSTETAVARNADSDTLGSARFTQLGIGPYEVKVEASGFAPFTTHTEVNSGAVTTVPITLEIKTTQLEMTVSESSSPLNAVNSQLQLSTETAKVANLPLNGGVLALSSITPGVTPVTPRNPFLGLGSFNSNGGRGRGNNITLDNATATDVSTTGGAALGTVPIDAIKEFNIITNNFNAEYGRNSSAQVQILTKSGSNAFHGTLFEYFRNDKLNTRDYFDTTGSATITRDNDWGAVGGGRVVRDKLFWYGTYEQQKVRGAGGTRVATVPRPDQLSGPIDPTAKALLSRLQVPASSSGAISNSSPQATNFYAFGGRVDANLTHSDFFFARFGVSDIVQTRPGLTFISSNLPTNGANVVNRSYNGTLSETHLFGPRTVNQILASFGRSAPSFAPLFNFGGPAIDFGDGTSSFGIWAGIPQGRLQNTYQYLDTLARTMGSHQFKFGAELNRIQANSFFDSNVRGSFTFLTLSDFLQGKPFQYSQRFGNSVRGNRVWNEFFFAQDDYRVSRFLTLNLGMRLEVAHGITEVNNILSNLNLKKNAPLGGAGTGPLGAFDIAGSSFGRNWNWAPRLGFAWNPNGGKLVVRGGYGIAYDFIYLNPITNMRFLPPFMFQFVLPSTGFTGSNSFANLIAGASEFQQQGVATVGNFGTTIRNFGNIGPVDQHLRNPQVHQWSLTFERQLIWGLVGRASYVGTKGNYLQRTHPINTIQPGRFRPPANAAEEAEMQRNGVFTMINAGLMAPPTSPSIRLDPRFNAVSLVDASANSNYHSAQFYAGRRFASGYAFTASYTISKSIDDVSDALGVLAGDTPAQQDPFNNRNNRAVSQFDTPQRLVITHFFEPQFTSRIGNPILRAVLHGWQFSGIFQAQKGFPVNLFSGRRAGLADSLLLGGDAAGSGLGAARPDVVGPILLKFEPNPGSGSRNPDKAATSGLAQPLVGHFGNLGRNRLRLNPLIQADWTVGKQFHLTERFRTEFQARTFNVFNNTTFSRPGQFMSQAPATFGYYSDTDTDTRNMTLSLKLIF